MWRAAPHPFLLAEQGEPEEGWMRSGPAALTRAWCIFELAKSLAKRCTLHVLLSPASVQLFEERMSKPPAEFEDGLEGWEWVAKLLGGIDVKLAQITKTEDRRAPRTRLAPTCPPARDVEGAIAPRPFQPPSPDHNHPLHERYPSPYAGSTSWARWASSRAASAQSTRT